jgi:hypothetical protein
MVDAGAHPRHSVPAARRSSAWARPERLAYGVVLVGVVIQAATGFGGKLLFGENAGWLLLIHMLGAPLFIVGLAGTAITWAERCRFGTGGTCVGRRLPPTQRLLFWAGLVFGLATVSTMLAAMLPVFGYAALDALREAHEFSALLLLVTVGAHVVLLLAAKRARR